MNSSALQTNHKWFQEPCATVNLSVLEQAQQYQNTLTKPVGSLGELETIATKFAAWQSTLDPQCEQVMVRVYAGDHGVCAQQVSAFPQAVTTQMIQNFLMGGAAISVLSKQLKADFAVVNMGTVETCDNAAHLINAQLMPGTLDFTQTDAMSEDIMLQAMHVGKEQITGANVDLFIGGEMGIGNTTSASTIYSVLLNLPPETTVGPGTGIDEEGMQRKRKAVDQAIKRHSGHCHNATDVLQRVGGLEIAGLTGNYIACAQQGIPILVDGFITTAAALLAARINPGVRDWLLFAHQSAEPAHQYALKDLNGKPILNLGMRLGEGSGAAVAVPVIQSALALHNQMATFDAAAVSESL